ncbi:MAG: hypothetical protein DRN37_09140 [Thermoplasmata archaeon]|nr:MAG: hypothetical protein DRN37_09140 [Thermoplasmata archaeon]
MKRSNIVTEIGKTVFKSDFFPRATTVRTVAEEKNHLKRGRALFPFQSALKLQKLADIAP